jgi:hypothetical protein
MLLVIGYTSKRELAESVGQPLSYEETSAFGPEYKRDGVLTVAHRPALVPMSQRKGLGREFFAQVTMENGLIKSVK